MSDLEEEFRTFREDNLVFEKAQLTVTNELSKELVGLEQIGKFETREERENTGPRNIISLISMLDDSVARAISIIKGALKDKTATIIEFPEKIEKAIKAIEKIPGQKHLSAKR